MLGIAAYKRVLLPFSSSDSLEHTLGPALDAVQETSAELLLLRVYPTPDFPQDTCSEETLYSDLRGLQARLQSQEIPLHMDTIAGPPARSIVRYAGEHGVDLIVVPKGDGALQTAEGTLAERVVRRALCETWVVE